MHNDSHFAGKRENTGTSSKSGGKSQQFPREGSSGGKEGGGKDPNTWIAKRWPNTLEYPPEYRKVMCVRVLCASRDTASGAKEANDEPFTSEQAAFRISSC